MVQNNKYNSGFTLIQMSIALIIIGLITGGILAGQNLIQAAAISAQISQISKYQQAVINFQTKYNNYLPGDIPDPYAAQYGFQSRGQYRGQGDGNGVLEADCWNNSGHTTNLGFLGGCGEIATFWVDLSTANLIDTSIIYNGAGCPSPTSTGTAGLCGKINTWLPTAKIGSNNFVYVMSMSGQNYFGVSQIKKIGWAIESTGNLGAGRQTLTVQQAYTIDSKVDDGLPQSGSVTACYTDWDVVTDNAVWAAGSGNQGAGGGVNCVPTTTATPYQSYNCYDNNNAAGAQTYSISQNANAQNCALSFQFQAQ